MGFECFVCGKEFHEIKFIISHLKLNHFFKNDTEPMKCLVAGNTCTEEFYCLKKLKSHVKSCQSTFLTNNKPKPELRQIILEELFESAHISDCVSKQIYLLCLKLDPNKINLSF